MTKIILRDRNEDLVKEWNKAFTGTDITAECADIFADPMTDAVVSPANSFGFMNGGIDGVYARRWPDIQDRVQKAIRTHFAGELPVGCAVEVLIGSPNQNDYKWLIAAPTMRIPCDVSETINAYLAFRAVLISSMKFASVTCPGLGTAIGQMPYHACAKQMRHAYDSFKTFNDGKFDNDIAETFDRIHKQRKRYDYPQSKA